MRVALVYDRVNKYGGAERVLTTLHGIWPEAPVFTSVYDRGGAEWAKDWDIRTSFLQSLPFARKWHEGFGWLMPLAFESFDFSEFDVVISVTSEAAKGIITTPRQLHICYLLTPTRYLWSHAHDYLNIVPGFLKPLAGIFQSKLRIWDYAAVQRPDYILSISKLVQSRCWKYYRRESEVIRPTLGLREAGIRNKEEGDYFLVVSRLVPYKRIDLAIDACNRLKLPLTIVGTGSEEKKLKELAGPTIKFTGYLTDRELIEYYLNSKAVIMVQEEDFGLTAVEALSLGIPVISYQHSGAAEIIKNGDTGILFEEQSVDSLINALQKLDKLVKFRKLHNGRFSEKQFKEEFENKVKELWRRHQGNLT